MPGFFISFADRSWFVRLETVWALRLLRLVHHPSVVSSNSSVPVLTQIVASSSSCLPAISLPSPEFISAVVQAVHSTWNTGLAPPASLSSTSFAPLASSSVAVSAVQLPTAVPSSSSPALLLTGVGCSPSQSELSATAQQGRWPFLDPSFVNTFVTPITSHSTAMRFSALPPISANVASSSGSFGLPAPNGSSSLPSFQQVFVVSPGVSPIPAKLVAQIVLGKFVDLSDLLSVNVAQQDPELQLLLDGRVVLTSTPKRNKRRIEDIASWTEEFTIYSLILASRFPTTLTRSRPVQAIDSMHSPAVQWVCLVGVRSGVSRARGAHEHDRLVRN